MGCAAEQAVMYKMGRKRLEHISPGLSRVLELSQGAQQSPPLHITGLVVPGSNRSARVFKYRGKLKSALVTEELLPWGNVLMEHST